MALNHLKQKIHLRKETKVMKKLMNKKGFTLMEMLIVVAIIVILVAVSIPTFTASLDDAKEATDDANLRAAKAVALNNEMLDGWGDLLKDATTDVTLYYDVDAGAFVAGNTDADKGQSSAHSNEYIKVVITKDGDIKTPVDWAE